MSHPFGDLLSQHLHRKHGLSQAKLAAGILQDPAVIGKMCKGQRLNGPQARERVLDIICWLQEQMALGTVAEANNLLAAAGMGPLRTSEPVEVALLQRLYAATISEAMAIDSITKEDAIVSDMIVRHKFTYSPAPTWDTVALVAANDRLSQLPVDMIPPIKTLPPGSRMPFSVNPLFVGREMDLMRLASSLKGSETMVIGQIMAATGLGGIGKTQLAVAFVHHYGCFFAGGVYWLSFADPSIVPAEIAACGTTMPELRSDFATLDLETQVRQVLAAWQSPLPRLLVFDNCDEPALLAQWRPTTGGSRILITSRHQGWDAALGVQRLALDTLDRAQSIELLQKLCPDLTAMDSQLEQIAAELGDLPLALHLAGNYLVRYRTVTSPSQYLAQLRQPKRLQHRSMQNSNLSPTGHIQHVARTFALSYERLDSNEQVDVIARALLARAACFAPGQLIPSSLLLSCIALEEVDGALQAVDALHRLLNLGLLGMDTAGNLLMHRLVAHFIQNTESETITETQKIVAETLLAEAERINKIGVPEPLLVWQSHLRHITDAVQIQEDELAARLCNALGFHLKMISDLAAAKRYSERAVAIGEVILGTQHPDTAKLYDNLGMLLMDSGDLAVAKSYHERALAIREAVLGVQHLDTAQSYSNMGRLLQMSGDLAAAKSYYERALAIREAVLGVQHPATEVVRRTISTLNETLSETYQQSVS